MTKEEIARKHGFINGISFYSKTTAIENNLYKAMQEYADQQLKLCEVGVSLEPKEQKILALLLINHINNLDKSGLKNKELIEEYRNSYLKLLDKINEA